MNKSMRLGGAASSHWARRGRGGWAKGRMKKERGSPGRGEEVPVGRGRLGRGARGQEAPVGRGRRVVRP